MTKVEIYQIGKVPPLTIVECDDWKCIYDDIAPNVRFIKNNQIVAMFFLNNIAGFKEVDGDTE